MFDMLAYISVPYALKDKNSQREAILVLGKFIAGFVRKNPKWYVVNSLYNEYGNLNIEDAIYYGSNMLIRSCDMFLVLKAKGWEYDHIVNNEAAYAAVLKKPIEYVELDYINL